MIQKYNMLKDEVENYQYLKDVDGKCLIAPVMKLLLIEHTFLNLKIVSITIAYKDKNGLYAYSGITAFNPEQISNAIIPKINNRNLHILKNTKILLELDFISYKLEDYKHLLSEFLL